MTEEEEDFCDVLVALEDAQEAITELVLQAESGAGAIVSTVQPRAILAKITRFLEGPAEGTDDDAEVTTDDFEEATDFGLALVEEATAAISDLTRELSA
jgi:hypothetical protein